MHRLCSFLARKEGRWHNVCIMKSTTFFRFGLVTLLLAVGTSVAYASHSWGNYHWARMANPFTLKLGDNVSSLWDAHLRTASLDWNTPTANTSAVLATAVVSGSAGRNCRPTAGRVEVCNNKYGNNGWLGIASVWANGEHITQGTVKVNDTYFGKAPYNTAPWKQFVMCQEIGHTFGLDHQDEDFTNPNLGTCMDYTSSPGSNQHPNEHDFAQLASIYAHLDTSTTVGKAVTSRNNMDDSERTSVSEWGKEKRRSRDGRSSLFEKDFGKGEKVFTFVVWAE